MAGRVPTIARIAGASTIAAASTGPATNDTVATSSADAHYERHVAPLADAFEARRREALEAFTSRAYLVVPGAIVVFAAAVWAIISIRGPDFIFIAIAGGLLGWGTWWFVSRPLEEYKTAVRGEVFPKIVSFFGSDFSYSRDCPWSMSRLTNSSLFDTFDDETLEDYIRGSYKDVSIELVEALLTKQVQSGRSRRTVEVYDGLLFLLTPRKKFRGKIVVKRDHGVALNAIRGFFTTAFSELERVKLEDPAFEKRFQVYADNQVEARRVLTTSFMQRLLDLGTVIGNQKVDCSFFEGVLLIRAPTSHNYFEPSSPFSPVDFQRDFETFIEEMAIVRKIIDTLKLDMDIGL
jgi:hypothetical protein